ARRSVLPGDTSQSSGGAHRPPGPRECGEYDRIRPAYRPAAGRRTLPGALCRGMSVPRTTVATVDEPEKPPDVPSSQRALSPSRAADFMTCPLLYRFRV